MRLENCTPTIYGRVQKNLGFIFKKQNPAGFCFFWGFMEFCFFVFLP